MSEWKETSIGSLCTIKHGFAYKGEYITNEKSCNVLVTPGNFTLSGGFKMMDKPKYYKGPVEKEYILKEGDLIVTMTDLSKGIDTLGYSALVPKINGITFHHNQRIGLIENISEEVDKGFLYWTMRTRPYQRFVANSSSGTTVHHTSPNNISRYSFLLPPLEIQKNIASILSSLDSKIAVNRRICENLEAQAQALFKHWFIDFAPFKNGKFVESELGMIPEGWRVGTLGEIAEISSGKRPKSRYNNQTKEHNIPLIGASCIMGYTDDIFTSNRILLTGRVGTLGVVQRFNSACWPSDNTLVLSTNFYEFVYQTIKTVNYSAMNRGTSQPLITQGDLKKTLITIPSNSILNKYEEVAGDIMSYIDFHFKESSRLSTLRDTLLPKLMSGQIKV